jgi:hypothetical protein
MHYAMKTYGSVEVQHQFTWPRHRMGVSYKLQAPAALILETSSGYPLDRRLSEPRSLSGRCGDKKNLALPGIETGLFSL